MSGHTEGAVTKRKPLEEMERPYRRAGDEELRKYLVCPLCQAPAKGLPLPRPEDFEGLPPLRVVAYRQSTVRFECRECGLRFSITKSNYSHAFRKVRVAYREWRERAIERYSSDQDEP